MPEIIIVDIDAQELTDNGYDLPLCPICQQPGNLDYHKADFYPCGHWVGVQFSDGWIPFQFDTFTHVVNVYGAYVSGDIEEHYFNMG